MAYGVTVSGEVAAKLQQTPARPPESTQGLPGLPMRMGRPAVEHNLRLTSGQNFVDYRKMMRSPAPQKAFAMQRDLCLSGAATIEKPNPDASDEPAVLLREQFGLDEFAGAGRMDMPLHEYVADMLEVAPFGCWLGEEQYEHADGVDWLKGWRKREIDSVDAWVVDQDYVLAGVLQKPQYDSTTGQSGARFMAANQLLHLVQFGSANNPEGLGDFRPIWPIWLHCERTYNLLMIGAQRYAVPSVDVMIDLRIAKECGAIPAAALGDTAVLKAWLVSEQGDAEAWAKKYAAGERSYIVRPPWWVIGTFGGDAMETLPLVRQIEHYERVMLQAGLAQFLQLGSAGSGGSYSLSQTHADSAIQAGEAKRRLIEDRINGPGRPGRGTIGRILHYNFGEALKPKEYPRLKFSPIRAPRFLDHLAEVVALAGGRALLSPDEKLEEWVRDALEMPPAEAPLSAFDRAGRNPLATEAGQQARGPRPINAPLRTDDEEQAA